MIIIVLGPYVVDITISHVHSDIEVTVSSNPAQGEMQFSRGTCSGAHLDKHLRKEYFIALNTYRINDLNLYARIRQRDSGGVSLVECLYNI